MVQEIVRSPFSLLAHDSTSRSNDGHPDYFESFVTLFEQGHIRLAQYENIRTISQYLLESIAPDKHFIYSALPVKSSQRRLLALIRRSLTYSDLSGLRSDRDWNVEWFNFQLSSASSALSSPSVK